MGPTRPGRPASRTSTTTVPATTSTRITFGAAAYYVEVFAEQRATIKLGGAAVAIAAVTETGCIALAAQERVGLFINDPFGELDRQSAMAVYCTAATNIQVTEWDVKVRDGGAFGGSYA